MESKEAALADISRRGIYWLDNGELTEWRGKLEVWKVDMTKLRGSPGRLCGSGVAEALAQGQTGDGGREGTLTHG